jgi:hypothetical protein
MTEAELCHQAVLAGVPYEISGVVIDGHEWILWIDYGGQGLSGEPYFWTNDAGGRTIDFDSEDDAFAFLDTIPTGEP